MYNLFYMNCRTWCRWSWSKMQAFSS